MIKKFTKTIQTILQVSSFSFSCLIIIVCLLLTCEPLHSQVVKKKEKNKVQDGDTKFELGFSSGLAINNFSGEQPHTGINLGFTGGMSINYLMYKRLSLQIEMNYIQKGGQLIRFKDDTRYGVPENFSSKNVKNSSYILHSLDIPLLLNYTFKIKQDWKPSIYVGGSLTYVAGSTERYEKTGDLSPGEDVIGTVTGYQNVSGEFEKIHYNSVIGSKIQLPLYKKSFLVLDCRYVAGLTAAKKDFSYIEKKGFGVDLRTNSFIIKAGIVFPLK